MSAETCLISHPCALFLYSPSPQSRKSRLKRRDTRLKQKPKMSSCACTTARQAVQPVPASSDKNDNALCHARDTKQVFLRKNYGLRKSFVTCWLTIIKNQIIQLIIIYLMVFKICARLYTCTTFPLS